MRLAIAVLLAATAACHHVSSCGPAQIPTHAGEAMDPPPAEPATAPANPDTTPVEVGT